MEKIRYVYRETPLADLSALAGRLGVAGFYVKDESFRNRITTVFWNIGRFYCSHREMSKDKRKNI